VRRDAWRLPPELRDELYERLVGRPYAQVVGWLQDRFADAADAPDLHALALVLIESISGLSLAATHVWAHTGRRRRAALHRRLGRVSAPGEN
jgi:hypothetical protein